MTTLPSPRRRLLLALAALSLSLSLSQGLVPPAGAAENAAVPPPADVELALVDLRGKRRNLGTLPGSVFAPRVSPDGKQVVFELQDLAAEGERPPMRLEVADLANLDQRRALPMVGEGRNWAAVWTQDGSRLVFQASGPQPDALWIRAADGSGEATKLLDARAPEGLYDGDRKLAFITLTGNRDYGISLLDLQSREVTRLVDAAGSEQHSSRISPDGRWVAYASNETGRQEVWLEPLPATGKRYRLTDDGGSHPLWAPDGETLYFDRANRLYRVGVFTGAEAPKVGEPKALPIHGFLQGDLRRQFDLTPDGKRFLMLFPVER